MQLINPKGDGILRHILTAAGPVLVTLGIVEDTAVWTQIVGAVMTLVGFAWSFMAPEKQ